MFRHLDPLVLVPLAGLLLLLVTTMLTACVWRRARKWLMPRRFAGLYVAAGVLALTVVLTVADLVWIVLPVNAESPETIVVKIDAVSNAPLAGYPVLTGDCPTEPGDYRVTTKNRHFLLHLPTGYDASNKNNPLPILCLLHGGHEDDPTGWGRKSEMTKFADRDGFIVIYPIAQPMYSLWGTKYYAWNSPLGTLSKYDNRFQDDAQFLTMVYQWVTRNLNVSKRNFNLGGFSEGALMATVMAQTGGIPINCLISCGGTMLEGQQYRHSKKLPNHILIQLNMEDAKVLPNDQNGLVVKGEQYWQAVYLVGYKNMARSKPLLQESYWRQEVLAGGGREEKHITAKEEGVYKSDTYLILQPDGTKRSTRADLVIKGQHAWHGSLEGGDPDDGIEPCMAYPLGDFIAKFIMDHRWYPPGNN